MPIEETADDAEVARAVDRLTQLMKDWRQGLAPKRRGIVRSVRALLADCHVLHVSQPWGDELLSDAAPAVLRREVMSHGEEWRDAMIRVDDVRAGLPRLVVAYKPATRASLGRLAEALGAKLDVLLSHAAAAWQFGGAGHGRQGAVRAVGVVAEGGATLMWGGKSVEGISCRGHAFATEGRRALSDHWARVRLRCPALDTVGTLSVIDLTGAQSANETDTAISVWPGTPAERTVPPALVLASRTWGRASPFNAAPDQDVSKPRRVVLAAVSAACMALLIQWGRTEVALHAAEHEAAQVRVSVERQRMQPVATYSKQDLARLRAVNAAVEELNAPFQDVLKALDPPADIFVSLLQAQWTNSHGTQGPTVKVIAHARDVVDMTRYVALVADRKGVRHADLTQHETLSANGGVRFSMEVVWNE